jgi:hypothetical protein
MDGLQWRLEYSRSIYNETVEETRRLRDRVSYVMGVFIIPLSSAIFFLYSRQEGDLLSLWAIALFLLPLSLASLSLIASVFVMFMVMKDSYEYEGPPSPSKLSVFYKNNPSISDLMEGLISVYDSAVDHNVSVNVRRSNRLMLVQKISAWSIPALLLAAIYSFSVSFNKPEPPQKVEVIFHGQ